MLYIFTLTWNAGDKLNKLKESLLPALKNVNYKWFIKDNASKDDTVAMVSSWGDNVKVFPYKDNRQNFSEGMNYLFVEASPGDNDLVLLLNNDITFNDKNSLNNMIDIMNNDNSVGVVGARLLYTNTDQLQHAGVVFDPSILLPGHFRVKEKTDANAEKNRLFQVVTGAVLLTKGEYFKNACTTNASGIKGMDEKYHWGFDDVDLCLSIKYNMEKKIVYCGRTNIFHEESASLKKNPTHKLFMGHNSNTLISKWSRRCVGDRDFYKNDPAYNLYKGK
jgi:GT2 family glycosyltransferase